MKQLPRSLSRPPVLPNLPNLLILPMLFRQAMYQGTMHMEHKDTKTRFQLNSTKTPPIPSPSGKHVPLERLQKASEC
jgi:hypothetical protein